MNTSRRQKLIKEAAASPPLRTRVSQARLRRRSKSYRPLCGFSS